MKYETSIDALARRLAAHDPALSEEEVDDIAVQIGDTPRLNADGSGVLVTIGDQEITIPAAVVFGEEPTP